MKYRLFTGFSSAFSDLDGSFLSYNTRPFEETPGETVQ